MKKIRPIKNTQCGWLINFIHEPKTKGVSGFKDKVISLFKTNTPKQKGMRKKKETKQTKNKNNLKKTKITALEKEKKEKKKS